MLRIRKYARTVDRRPFGVVVGELTDTGDIFLGFSCCNPKDSYNRNRGNLIAEGRLNTRKFHCSVNDPAVAGIENHNCDRLNETMAWVIEELQYRWNRRNNGNA